MSNDNFLQPTNAEERIAHAIFKIMKNPSLPVKGPTKVSNNDQPLYELAIVNEH